MITIIIIIVNNVWLLCNFMTVQICQSTTLLVCSAGCISRGKFVCFTHYSLICKNAVDVLIYDLCVCAALRESV